jgi:nitric-oxide synthase
MVTAVGGHGGYPGGKQFVTAEELREKLAHLRHEKALIVKLVKDRVMSNLCGWMAVSSLCLFWHSFGCYMQVDIVDFNGSFLARIRDFAGANPIVLVITKVNLAPYQSSKHYCHCCCQPTEARSSSQVDLLPRDTDLNCVGDWVVESVVRKKLK